LQGHNHGLRLRNYSSANKPNFSKRNILYVPLIS
jgi:hypothetical protein